MRELIRHGFEDLRLNRVFAYVRTLHLDVADALLGSELGAVEYAITREQWMSG
ncbi:hypothetical protein [Modestobacter sp. DSM 44400]|uniref:hypothetical protein n=1 Tax=Modestobacter sp. DSM 44400 TaxID=1550230 RepID=UPI001C31A69E|nr:hypothetical protein [Modestobacter sp. DSM 44400]